ELDEIHQRELIHCDFHHGNILNIQNNVLSISDLGLCKPVEYFQLTKKNEIYDVLPFVAPEEFISGIIPFNDKAYNEQLALSICKGKRSEIIKNIPQCYINL
ncbi:5777_t:CDS:2, partial [Funneliformis geosporum]